MTQHQITDDLPAFFAVLPNEYLRELKENNNVNDLFEIIMDLGRLPTARFVNREIEIHDKGVSREQIDELVSRIGDFDSDNRAGIERTLHRISAMRNKHGDVVGLTCRVGRAVYGTIDIIEDLVDTGKSILLLGRPGIGKTTMLREVARILAEKTRVVIVDTSNEIGRELEAAAARTIAERGVQLVATAHGRTLENLLLNPTLSDLVGGIESVTLSDEEARRRGTQKTVLERRSPPTFDVLVEIQERDRLAVHEDVASAVDTLLRGFTLQPEIRFRDENNQIHIQKPQNRPLVTANNPQGMRRSAPSGSFAKNNTRSYRSEGLPNKTVLSDSAEQPLSLKPIIVFPYGVARNRLESAAKKLGVPLKLARKLDDASILLTLKSHYRNRQRPILDAEEQGIPIFVLRSNSNTQIEQTLVDLFHLNETKGRRVNLDRVTSQTHQAIEAVRNGQRFVDLPSASSRVRRVQHELVRDANLISHSYGKEPNRHVRVFRE